MDDALFYLEVERLDAELSSVPLILRQLDIYHALIGLEERNELSLGYLNKISAWYQQKYGSDAAWDGVIGRQPVLLRGKLHIIQIRHPSVNPKDGLGEMLEGFERQGYPVSAEEYRYLAMTDLESSGDFAALHNMEMRPSLFNKEQRGLSRRAWFDLKNASIVLESSSDIQGSIVSAHEAAEKFLKIALIHEGHEYSKLGRGLLKHNLNDLIKALIIKHPKYKFIKRPARDLQALFKSMTVQRYESAKCSFADAIEAFRFARHCCGFVAMQIEMDDERGGPDITFKPGFYYQDYSGRQYRFCGFDRNDKGEHLCRLYLLEATDKGQTVDALIASKEPCSFHYKRIKDQPTIARLEARYSSIQGQMRIHRKAEYEQGVTIERVHESFDAILSIRRPVRKPPMKDSEEIG